MTKHRVTLQQMADELGTSKVTVSRARNNQPGIGDELRRRILELAKLYGYPLPEQVDPRVHALAFLIPQKFFLEMDHFYTVIYFHLNRLCQAKDILLSAITISQQEEQEGTLPAAFLCQKFDGIFLVGDSGPRISEKLAEYAQPIVRIDYPQQKRESCVVSDNYRLGFELGEHLIRRGHSRIGFVGDYRHNTNICDRYLGVHKALMLNGLPFHSGYDLINNDFRTGLYTLSFAMPSELPTAYVCFCDMAAYYLYEKLYMMGLSVPEDVSVVSFDNTEICENMRPRLSSMEIDKEDFARLSFEQMVNEITDPLTQPAQRYVRCRFIERDSVATLS